MAILSSPQWRSASLHLITFSSGALAAVSFMASHSVDLYAIYDQASVVWKDLQTLVALATPIASGAYAVYKATTTQKLKDVAKDDDFKGAVVSPELAKAVPSEKVQATVGDLPPAAKV